MADLTHPNRVLRAKNLDRFKEKLIEEGLTVNPASVETCEDIIDELT